MQLGRRKHAAAVALAVIGGLLGPLAPAALAAPAGPDGPASTTAERTGDARLPAVWPRPQSLRASGQPVALGTEVTVLADAEADPYTVDALQELLRDSGVRTVHDALPGEGPVIRLGGTGAGRALRALGAADRGDLPSGGYRLAVGRADGRLPRSPWTASARTACSTACRRCGGSCGAAPWPVPWSATGRVPPCAG